MTSAGPAGTRCDDALETLERALAYTRGALATVTSADLGRRTPCSDWLLLDLLTHMDDALDAFNDGAHGWVPLTPSAPAPVRIERLQAKACGLLGAWSRPLAPPANATVRVAGLPVERSVVAGVAALEIAVHGWDVAATTGRARPLPTGLAAALLPVALRHIDDADRGRTFDPPLPCPSTATPSDRLLAHLGRRRPCVHPPV